MIQVQIDETELRAMYMKKMDEKLEEIEGEVFFLDSAGLCKYVGMSWVSVSKYLLSDPEFPQIRLGKKFLYPRNEVKKYLEKYFDEVRNDTGDITTFKRKGG